MQAKLPQDTNRLAADQVTVTAEGEATLRLSTAAAAAVTAPAVAAPASSALVSKTGMDDAKTVGEKEARGVPTSVPAPPLASPASKRRTESFESMYGGR